MFKVRALCSNSKVVCIHKAARARVDRLVVSRFVYTLKRSGATTLPVVSRSAVIAICFFPSEFHEETTVLQ